MAANEKSELSARAIRARIRRLQSFADLYVEIDREVCGLPNSKLKGLIEAAGLVTQTNCGWGKYRVAPIVAKMAEAEIQRRKLAKQRKKKAPRQ